MLLGKTVEVPLVEEYVNGRFGWLMFAAFGLTSNDGGSSPLPASGWATRMPAPFNVGSSARSCDRPIASPRAVPQATTASAAPTAGTQRFVHDDDRRLT